MLERLQDCSELVSNNIIFGRKGLICICGKAKTGKSSLMQKIESNLTNHSSIEILRIEPTTESESRGELFWSNVRKQWNNLKNTISKHYFQPNTWPSTNVVDTIECTFSQAFELSNGTLQCIGFTWEPQEEKHHSSYNYFIDEDVYTFSFFGTVYRHSLVPNNEINKGNPSHVFLKDVTTPRPAATGEWMVGELQQRNSIVSEIQSRWRSENSKTGVVLVDEWDINNFTETREKSLLSTLLALSEICTVVVASQKNLKEMLGHKHSYTTEEIILPAFADHEKVLEATKIDIGRMKNVNSDIKKIVAEYVVTPWTGMADVKARVAEVAPKIQELRDNGIHNKQRLFTDELYALCAPSASSGETFGNFTEEIILLSIFLCKVRSGKLQQLENDNSKRLNKRQKTTHLKGISRARDAMLRDNKSHEVTLPRLCDQVASLLSAYEIQDDKPNSMSFTFEWYEEHHGCKQFRRDSMLEYLRSMQSSCSFLPIDDKTQRVDSSSVTLRQAQLIARRHGVPSPAQEEYPLLFAGTAAMYS